MQTHWKKPCPAVFLAGLILLSGGPLGVSPVSAKNENFWPAPSEKAAKPIVSSRFSDMNTPAKDQHSGSFNMGQAVRYALEHNPGLGSSEAAARASEEGRKSARGALFPKLGTTYSYYKQARTTSVREASNPPSMGTYTWTVEVSQILFDGFNNLGTYQKQALQAESDRASIRSSELDTTNSVQETFIDYLCSLENVASEKEAVSRLKDQKRITGAMHDAGLKPKLDVLQADVDLGNAEQQLITYENTRDTLRAKLNTLLGIPATSPVRYAGGLSVTRFRLSLDTCLDTAYKMRPDLYVSYKAVEMAIKDRLIARSGYYPTVEAYYNVSKTGNTPDLERGGTHSSRSTSWEVGAKLTWDVFQWGTTYFADQQAGWLVSKMRKQVREVILNIGYDVKEKFLALREAEKRIDVAKRSLVSARESYEAALGQYKAQMGTNFDVLDASSKLLTAQSSLTSARGDYLKALSELYLAMGEYHPDLL